MADLVSSTALHDAFDPAHVRGRSGSGRSAVALRALERNERSADGAAARSVAAVTDERRPLRRSRAQGRQLAPARSSSGC